MTTEDDTNAFCRNSLSKPSEAFHSLHDCLLPTTIAVTVREASAKAYEVVQELGKTVSRGRWYTRQRLAPTLWRVECSGRI